MSFSEKKDFHVAYFRSNVKYSGEESSVIFNILGLKAKEMAECDSLQILKLCVECAIWRHVNMPLTYPPNYFCWSLTPAFYREKPSPPYTETTPEHLVKLDLKRSQQSDYNDNWPSCEIATQACHQSWVLVRAINTRCCTYWIMHYWWSSFEVWGPFLLRRKRPQWSPYGQHLTWRYRQDQPSVYSWLTAVWWVFCRNFFPSH